MKHVFGIASHLVFYLCNRYIEKHQLPIEDCILLLTRNYQLPSTYAQHYPHVIATDYSPKKRVWAGVHFWKTIRNKQQFDQLLSSFLKGEDFIYYTQVCNNEICNLMVSMPNCKGYYVVEDGSGSYRTFNPQTFIGWQEWIYRLLLKPLFPRFYCIKNHFIETEHPKFMGCIASSQDCFPLHQQYLEVIGLPFEKIDLGYSPDAVISIDPLYLYFDTDKAQEILRSMGETIRQKHYKTIAYKLHPNLYTQAFSKEKNMYLHTLMQGLNKMEEIPSTTCLENVVTTYHSDFYTVFSSVAIYAHLAGCTCYSPLHRIKDQIPTHIALVEELSQPI